MKKINSFLTVITLLLFFNKNLFANNFRLLVLAKNNDETKNEYMKWDYQKEIEPNYYALYYQQRYALEVMLKKTGFVSLWYQSTNVTKKILPYPGKNLYFIAANEKYKIATQNTTTFKANDPDVTENFYVIWTEKKEQQPKKIEHLTQLNNPSYAWKTMSMRIDVSPETLSSQKNTHKV